MDEFLVLNGYHRSMYRFEKDCIELLTVFREYGVHVATTILVRQKVISAEPNHILDITVKSRESVDSRYVEVYDFIKNNS